MPGKYDWLPGEYFIYNFEDAAGPIIDYPIRIEKDSKGKVRVFWQLNHDFKYIGKIEIRGNNIYALSMREDREEFVCTIFPKPNTNYINLLWGVAVGTLPRGNKPIACRVLWSKKRLTRIEAKQHFDSVSENPKEHMVIIDYNVEEKNKRDDGKQIDSKLIDLQKKIKKKYPNLLDETD